MEIGFWGVLLLQVNIEGLSFNGGAAYFVCANALDVCLLCQLATDRLLLAASCQLPAACTFLRLCVLSLYQPNLSALHYLCLCYHQALCVASNPFHHSFLISSAPVPCLSHPISCHWHGVLTRHRTVDIDFLLFFWPAGHVQGPVCRLDKSSRAGDISIGRIQEMDWPCVPTLSQTRQAMAITGYVQFCVTVNLMYPRRLATKSERSLHRRPRCWRMRRG